MMQEINKDSAAYRAMRPNYSKIAAKKWLQVFHLAADNPNKEVLVPVSKVPYTLTTLRTKLSEAILYLANTPTVAEPEFRTQEEYQILKSRIKFRVAFDGVKIVPKKAVTFQPADIAEIVEDNQVASTREDWKGIVTNFLESNQKEITIRVSLFDETDINWIHKSLANLEGIIYDIDDDCRTLVIKRISK